MVIVFMGHVSNFLSLDNNIELKSEIINLKAHSKVENTEIEINVFLLDINVEVLFNQIVMVNKFEEDSHHMFL